MTSLLCDVGGEVSLCLTYLMNGSGWCHGHAGWRNGT